MSSSSARHSHDNKDNAKIRGLTLPWLFDIYMYLCQGSSYFPISRFASEYYCGTNSTRLEGR